MHDILRHNCLKLIYAGDKLTAAFPGDAGWNLDAWQIEGDWHIMTVDTNDDKSSGLDGGIAVDCVGSWTGGTMETTIALGNYGEILFEHYVQNGLEGAPGESNRLAFYVDGVKKLEITGPSPWQRCEPIGLTPGGHNLRFEYIAEGGLSFKKAVVDTVTIREGRTVKCLISNVAPPRPLRSIGKNSVLRGFSRYQEMSEADTEIKLSAIFGGHDFLEFMRRFDGPFYFVDEFGICYRGIFPETINPKSVAMNAVYSVELVMIAGQRAGVGFANWFRE